MVGCVKKNKKNATFVTIMLHFLCTIYIDRSKKYFSVFYKKVSKKTLSFSN